MEQQIRFCTTSDGVNIAYATAGDGPPLVCACGWPTHLELEWEAPSSRTFLEDLAQGCTLIRYDMRGAGLSDRDATDMSLVALTRDLEAVVAHVNPKSFALMSLGVLAGPVAMMYAAAHQQRVARLVLSSPLVRGAEIIAPGRQRAMIEYTAEFGAPTFDYVDGPTVDIEAQRDVQRRQETAASPKTQAALLRTLFSVDVRSLLHHLTMPTLVLHGRQDSLAPFAQGRELAAGLPQATFVPFEGQSSAAWTQRSVIIPEIRRFLGIEPGITSTPSSGLVTVLFTDVEGSTALNQRLGDARAREVLREHERIVREALKAHGGSEVKTTGDGFMTSFSSATRALECSIAMQRAFAAHNESAEEPIRVRVGLNAGEPIAEDEDLFGAAVIMAARIAGEAKGGEILTSDVVRQLVAGKQFLFADRGEIALRGFDEPVRLYEVRWED
jgi:class 3 adenylate cyclase/pimeloyl-ACP methyl ester carboxylesterase